MTSQPRLVSRSAAERFVDGALSGFVLGLTILCVDTLFFYFERIAWLVNAEALPASKASLIANYAGAAAPWTLLLTAWAGGISWGLGPRVYTLRGRLLHWLWNKDDGVFGRAAATLTTLSGAALFVAAAGVVGVRTLQTVRTMVLAVGLLLLLQVGLLAAVALSMAPVHAALRTWLTAARCNWARSLLTPGALCSLFCASAAGLVAVMLPSTIELSALPWSFVVAPTLGLSLCAVSFGAFGGNARRRVAGLSLGLVLAVSAALPPFAAGDAATLRAVSDQPGFASLWLLLASRALDFDRDGVSSVYGGADCAPLNSAVSPLSEEIPDNGVDEDCSGRDLVAGSDKPLRPGRQNHPRPNGVVNRPHIVLITTDGLSRSRTGLGGNRGATPRLDAWAARATDFSDAFSFGSSTQDSLPALLTGAYTTDVATVNRQQAIPRPALRDDADTLASMLASLGYRTVALMPQRYFFSESRWPGLSRGFQTFDTTAEERARRREPGGRKPHTAPELTARAIDEIRHAQAPLFLWVHYYDHHTPYEPRPEWGAAAAAASTPVERFDAELRFADEHWGQLLAAIEETLAPEQYVAIFTSDHGEAFDDNHPKARHHFSLHTEELHVPLVIQANGGRGRRVKGLVNSLDIVPTLANLVPLSPKHRLAGESLLPVVFNGQEPEKTFLLSAMVNVTEAAYGRDVLRRVGLRTRDWYLVHQLDRGQQWLSRWRDDALERRDLATTEPDVVERLSHSLRRELHAMRNLGIRQSVASQAAVEGAASGL